MYSQSISHGISQNTLSHFRISQITITRKAPVDRRHSRLNWVILKADRKNARPHRLQDRTVCGQRPWCVYDHTVHHDRKNQIQFTTVHMTKRFSHITTRPRVKCGRADLRIFLDLKMTKPNYKPNTGPNANPNTKQTLILI